MTSSQIIVFGYVVTIGGLLLAALGLAVILVGRGGDRVTAKLSVQLKCDGKCGEWFRAPEKENVRPTISETRAWAKLAKWRYLKGRDYCPTCWARYMK